jgi:hypothetical protein
MKDKLYFCGVKCLTKKENKLIDKLKTLKRNEKTVFISSKMPKDRLGVNDFGSSIFYYKWYIAKPIFNRYRF